MNESDFWSINSLPTFTIKNSTTCSLNVPYIDPKNRSYNKRKPKPTSLIAFFWVLSTMDDWGQADCLKKHQLYNSILWFGYCSCIVSSAWLVLPTTRFWSSPSLACSWGPKLMKLHCPKFALAKSLFSTILPTWFLMWSTSLFCYFPVFLSSDFRRHSNFSILGGLPTSWIYTFCLYFVFLEPRILSEKKPSTQKFIYATIFRYQRATNHRTGLDLRCCRQL